MHYSITGLIYDAFANQPRIGLSWVWCVRWERGSLLDMQRLSEWREHPCSRHWGVDFFLLFKLFCTHGTAPLAWIVTLHHPCAD